MHEISLGHNRVVKNFYKKKKKTQKYFLGDQLIRGERTESKAKKEERNRSRNSEIRSRNEELTVGKVLLV